MRHLQIGVDYRYQQIEAARFLKNSFESLPLSFLINSSAIEECKRKREFKICCISAFLCLVEFVIGAKLNRTMPSSAPP